MSPEGIVDKIRAILARAERGSTEHERDTAMQMAEKFMFKHNLTMADVGDVDHDPGRDFTREREDIDLWSGRLLYNMAPLFFCKVYYHPTGRKTAPHFIVGRQDNVRVVRELHAYIAQQIEGEAAIGVAERGQLPRYARVVVEVWAVQRNMEFDESLADLQASGLRGDDGLQLIMNITGLTKAYASEIRPYIKKGRIAPEIVTDLATWRRSFIRAATNRVIKRLTAMHQVSVDEAGSKGTDLVYNEQTALQAYMDNDLGLNLNEGSKYQSLYSESGAQAGAEAGERADISLGNKVGRGGTRLLESGE